MGDWVSKDGENKMKIRRWDDSLYAVSVNGYLFRAYHSEVAGSPFASVQELETLQRNYSHVRWRLSADGKRLYWRTVSPRIIPENTKDSREVQKLLEKNLKNPDLFQEEQEYTREK